MKITSNFLLALCVLTLSTYISCARDPGPLQDFCVGVDDPKNMLYVNGKFCKDPEKVTADDFVCKGFSVPSDTNNAFGFNFTRFDADTCPGLNTMGVQKTRTDFAPGGINAPHVHPRGTEFVTIMKGRFYAGFVSSNADGNRLFSKILEEGDGFIFPQGMPHFNLNIAKKPGYAISAFSSQNAGAVTIGTALFRSDPLIDPRVLVKALLVDEETVRMIQERFEALET